MKQALGEQGANDFKRALYNARMRGITEMKWAALGKTVRNRVLWGVLTGLGLGGAYEIGKHVFGERFVATEDHKDGGNSRAGQKCLPEDGS